MSKMTLCFTRRPLFWIFQICIFLICSYFAGVYYQKAFPIVELPIEMDRQGALKAASDLARENQWGPQDFRQTTSFYLDQEAQTFIELFGGGNAAFAQVVKDKLYSPYTWIVRHFAEGKTNETLIRFTPQGSFYGFKETLPETEKGDALSAPEAQKIAEEQASKKWKLDLSEYQLVEKSQDLKPSHRVDHSFVYERSHQKFGEGKYRLELMLSGSKLTEIRHFLRIPDEFNRKYAEMRSANETIASIASIGMLLFYILGGCGIGIFFLAKQHWIIWKTPFYCGIGVAFLQFLEQLNQLPLLWMSYDTALSSSGFLISRISNQLVSFLGECLLLTASFIAAESLSRRVFPHHPQLWKIWRVKNAGTYEILGRTLGGYLSVGFFFSFVVFIYLFGSKTLGWWLPSDTLYQPDGLASYFPWLTSVSQSLHAGFWEECLFRAVPLAGAALIGERLGHRKKLLFFGFILQALIFGAAHANYPAQPSYARVIELIIPSFIFGGIFLRFGLLPAILLHYTFDVVSFSIPIFTITAPRIWLDRVMTILVSLIPLWIVIGARFFNGKWEDLRESELNQAWNPTPKKQLRADEIPLLPIQKFSPKVLGLLVFLGISGLVGWLFYFPFQNQTIPLQTTKAETVLLAKKALSEAGYSLSAEWKAYPSVLSGTSLEDRFVWKTAGKEEYAKLMGTYLAPPYWNVRFIRLDTDLSERAEEFHVNIADQGKIIQIAHYLPEGRKGAALDEEKARKLALTYLEKTYQLKPEAIREISSFASQLPARKDWLFQFLDPSVKLPHGEARIGVRISGDTPASSKRFIYIPEECSRQERNRNNLMIPVSIFSILVIAFIFIYGLYQSVSQRIQKKLSSNRLLFINTGLIFLGVILLINHVPIFLADLSTIEPLVNQYVRYFAFASVKILFFSICQALMIDYVTQVHLKPDPMNSISRVLLGYSLGIFGALLPYLISQFFPNSSPPVKKIEGLDSLIPPLESLSHLEKFIPLSLLFIFIGMILNSITRNGSYRKWLGFSFLLFVGFAVSGLLTEELSQWMVGGICATLFLNFFYLFCLQTRISLIPISVGICLCLLQYRQMIMNPYTGVEWMTVLSILLLLISSHYWYRKMNWLN